ncbi:hypothetical protein Trydic_g10770 [Trypoxylus dichotomus]
MSSRLMEFLNKLSYQESKIKSKCFVKFVIDELKKGDNSEIDVDEQWKYDLNLPIDFTQYLIDCNRTLIHCSFETPNFSGINNEYLIAIIYCGLCSQDSLSESESTPMQAVSLLFTLFSGKYGDAFKIDDETFIAVLERALDAIHDRVTDGRKLTASFASSWNHFLATNKRSFDVSRMAEVLSLAIAKNTSGIIESFDFDDDTWNETSKSLFTCFITIIETRSYEDVRNIIMIISLKLIKNCGDEIVNRNIIRFFKNVLHKFCSEKWYLLILLMVLKEIKNKEIFINIINKLPPSRHEVMLNMIINSYVQAVSDDDIKMYLLVLNLIIKIPYQDVPDDRRQKVVRRILTETYFRSSTKCFAIRELVMDLFISWSQMKDLYVRRHLQQMFQTSNKVQSARLFEMLLQGVDISWKTPGYNVTFIIFTCRMFMLNRTFITQYRMRILETLCYKATGHCIKPCVPTVTELIRQFALAPHPVLKPLLTMIVNNALSATPASNYYMKEFYDLIANCMVAQNDSDVDYALCNIILSDDFNCLELFKTLQIHNFIRGEHIKVLLEEKILKYPGSWKLLSVLLGRYEYKHFPQFFEHYLIKMSSPVFFTRPESIYVLQVIQKIFTFKIKSNAVIPSDKHLACTIEQYIIKSLRELAVPAKHTNDSLILLQTLNKITKSDLNWVKSFSKEKLTCVLRDDLNPPKTPLMRHLMYLEQMLVLFDAEIDESQMEQLLVIMSIENQQVLALADQIYTRLVSFFGKVCLKHPTHAKRAVPLLQHAMIKGSPPVQLLAMASLFDIATFVLNYYEPLYPGLLNLVKNFITLMLLLVDRNYKLCLFFLDVFETDFIHRNQHSTSKYFINLLFYLNNFTTHELYPVPKDQVSLGTQDFTYERRVIIYKFLFCNLERQNQLQILNALNEDFLMLFYKGKLDTTTSVLNILRDILTLISFYASQYMTEYEFKSVDEFFRGLIDDMNRDFFTRKRFAEGSIMVFDKTIEKLLFSLLKILYKVEKSHLNMLPQFLNAVGMLTRAFYNKVAHMVHDNTQLRDLYYELESCYTKYKEIIKTEPLDLLNFCEKEEWRLYLGYRRALTSFASLIRKEVRTSRLLVFLGA